MSIESIETTKIFMNGRSQAVRLPKAYRFDGDTVIIKRFGEGVLLIPMKSSAWNMMEEAVGEFENRLVLERASQGEQEREDLF